MPTISRPNTYTDGASTNAAQATANETTLYNLVNGNLDKDNLSPTANIADTQLAQISTASKVSGLALTSLDSIPSGAGVIPTANLPTATAYGVTSSSKKLKIVYATASTVTVTADEIILNNSTKITSVNFTCDVANGAGLNKLDTGTESDDSWYYIYAVDATHGFLSTSATSPTTGTVGTIYALLGAVRNTSGNFVPFKQYGKEYWYTTWITADSGYNKPTTTAIDLTTIVPSGLSEVVRGSVSGAGINGAAVSNISGFTFGAPAANVTSCYNLLDSPQKFEFNILTANTIYWTASNSSTAVCYVYVSGFKITSLT